MNGWRKWIKLLGLAGLFASLSYSPARCQHEYDPTVRIRPNQCETYVTLPRYGNAERVAPMHGLILRDLPERTREGIRGVLASPTLTAVGPTEIFCGDPKFYFWLLDHPDDAVRLWRKLGAKCLTITARDKDRFGWSDGNGSDISWETVFRGPTMRIWYAEGQAKPAALLPAVPVRAVAILHHWLGTDGNGVPVIRHHAQVVFQTDSKAAALVTKVMGASADRLAEQAVAQMELFYSALVWYLYQNPDRAKELGVYMHFSERTSQAPLLGKDPG